MTEKPWETEDWRNAPGIIQNPTQTNSALADRDYSVPCRYPSENKIRVLKGYWLWWCSVHHQPLSWCEKAKLRLAVDFLTGTIAKVQADLKAAVEKGTP